MRLAPAGLARTQACGLLLVVLTLGHEAQVVNAALPAESNETRVLGGQAFGEEDPLSRQTLVSEPDDVFAQLGALPRGLLAVVADWQWPAQTTLGFKHTHGSRGAVLTVGTTEVTVCASLLYSDVEITATGTAFGSDHSGARVKLVNNAADRTKCSTSSHDVPVGVASRSGSSTIKAEMGLSNQPLALTVNNDQLARSSVNIVFMQGGLYKLCYTPDGSFGGGDQSEFKENVVNTVIKVLGVKSPCTHGIADGCMESERWECLFGWKGEGIANCVFNLQTDGGRGGGTWSITPGQTSKMTWTSLYGADTLTGGGQLSSSTPRYCSQSTTPETALFDTSQTGYLLSIDRTTSATMPPVKSDHSTAFTMAACYCPSYNAAEGTYCTASNANQCCDHQMEFIQQFGVIYFWTIRICDYTNYLTCDPPHRYMRVLPQQKFVLRIDCPPGGGCAGTTANRVQYIDHTAYNDRPTWDATHGCQTVTTEAAAAVWPSTADSGAAVDGGDRVDYKVWRTKQVKINKSLKKRVDVCFCNSNCNLNPKTVGNWFMVGHIETTSAFALASKTAAGSSYETIRYVGYPGSMTFYGGIAKAAGDTTTTVNPYDSNMYSGKALINLVSYDREERFGIGSQRKTLEEHYNFNRALPSTFQETMDSECQRERYWPTLVTGPNTKQAAKAYVARVDALDDTVRQYLTFSGESQNNMMTVNKAGVLAICYCAMVTDQLECMSPAYWVFAGRITVQGPQGGQQWVLPTHVVVRLTVHGWGLSNNDRLRIIPSTSTCSSNSNNPLGDTSYKVGCPAKDGTDCRTVTTAEELPVNVLTASSSGIFITGVQTGVDQSTLQFSASVQGVLTEGDQVTIDFDRVLVNSKAEAAMGPEEEYEAYRLSGEWQFQDDQTKSYLVGHRVSNVVVSGATDYTRMSIPVGWNGGPTFSFVNDKGHWMRRNQISTNENIKASQAGSNLKVCWGVNDVGTKFYEQAGEISFQDPPPMTSARVSLTTKQRGAISPVVVSFKTFPQRAEYAQAQGKTMLMLRLLDVSESTSAGKLVPYFTGDFRPGGSPPAQVPTSGVSEEVVPSGRRQWVCGKLFAELWSPHSEGFPIPLGCYYGKKYRDQPENGNTPNFYRELYIVFGERNGLRQNTEYQIVLNAEVKEIVANEHLLDLYAMCAEEQGCERPYMVFEKGAALASATTEAVSSDSDPQMTDIEILGGDASKTLNLSQRNILMAKIAGGSLEVNKIQREQFIRLYLWPLTLWSVGSADCLARCDPYHASNAICRGAVGCVPEEIVAGSNRRNVLRLRLPSEMTPISDTTTHTISVSGLTLPVAGYFPLRMGVQLTSVDDAKPQYTTTNGFFMKDPEPGQTSGRLVMTGRTGYGPKPFLGDTQNSLYVRLQFGATVWNSGLNLLAAQFEITLPPGYTCSVPDNGAPLADMLVFSADEDADGYPDNNRGILSVDSADGDWENSQGGVCAYELNPHSALFAGQVAYVKLTVNNPGSAMPKLFNKNIWKLKLSSMGANRDLPAPVDVTEVEFISLAEERALRTGDRQYWASNAAVISRLEQETLQPSAFARSCCGGNLDQRRVQEFVHVFFKTTQHVGQNGFVILDAPAGFDFEQACQAQPLHEDYYAFIGTDTVVMNRLNNMGACVGSSYPAVVSSGVGTPARNRARLQVGGIIGAAKYYGFKVRVTHPSTYSTAQHTEWYLWTQDSNGYSIEGSYSTIRFNELRASTHTEFYHKSFGMYNADAGSIGVQVVNVRPQSLTLQDTDVIFYPIEFSVDTDTSLRITAPMGFYWSDPAAVFTTTTNGTSEPFPVPTVHTEVRNQLIWDSMSLKGRTRYGFRARVSVPDHNPVTSSNAFFIEFGFREQNIETRYMATVVPAPLVASLMNTRVVYSSNLVNFADNRLEFHLQLVSTLVENDGIVIKGDENTRGFDFQCDMTMLPGSAQFPSDLLCMKVPAQDGQPQITLKVDVTPVLPGYYKFELPVTNPVSRSSTPGTWTFGTYRQVSNYPGADPIDLALVAPGFVVNDAMTAAHLVTIGQDVRDRTGRNDRPGRRNSLIFKFQLSRRPDQDLDLILRAPRGFVFDENCIHVLQTDANEVFGANTGSQWPNEYAQWPPQFAPTACLGYGRDAHISIPAGLLNRNIYVFRIGVTNPMETPSWNMWSISYNSETSRPFMGFTVWTFTQLSISSTNSGKSPNPQGGMIALTASPVTITFQPFNPIPFKPPYDPHGGLLRVTAPAGYEFVQQNGECTVELFETGGTVTFTPSDLLCRVDSRTKLLLFMMGSKLIEGGRQYTLVAQVYNPPSTSAALTWSLDSFKDTSAEPYTPLDESHLPGFPINNVLITFLVSNVNDVRNGGANVYDVDITLQFPDPLLDNDEISITGPKGFNLVGNKDTMTCNNFRYAGGSNPLPTTGDPRCQYVSQITTMKWIINENREEAYPQNTDIRFKVATQNPSRTPFITDNFWKVYHMRGTTIKSSHVHPGWAINPQLGNVDVRLRDGSKRAAGSVSDIVVAFTPVSDAGTLKLEALFPTEFDFARARVRVPFDVDDRSEGPLVIINRLQLTAGSAVEIQISSVTLGRAGGQTRFNLMTYADETLAQKRDERLEFTGGFRLPGRVTVLGTPQLRSKYREARSTYPVRSLFPPRVLEPAKAEFRLSFSQPVTASQKLIITCQGAGAYSLEATPFVIIGTGQVDTAVELDPTTGALQATLKPGRPATELALQADTPYTVILWVNPRSGTNTWRFDTSDGLRDPTNTDDGETSGFAPVESLTLGVTAQRSPPGAIIDVTLSVNAGTAVIRELLVIAPPGFAFDERAAGCGENCVPGQPLGSTGRRTATISSPTGMPLTQLQGLVVRVRTPQGMPDNIEWFVEGRGQGAGTTTGWGVASGFLITQMLGTTVSYGGVANLWATRIAFTFATDVPGGTQIAVVPPANVRLTCSTEGALQQISLPGGRPDCIDYPLRLVLTTPLTVGTFAFAVEADLPPQTPAVNTFDVIIRDQDNNVIDAAYAVQGQTIMDIGVGSPTLAWSRADPGQHSMITIGIVFTRDTSGIKALLINFPTGFFHDVQRPTDVQNLNRHFPVQAGTDWADTSSPNAIKIRLDDTDASTVILADSYRFSFPVQMPSEIPPINLWFLSLCDSVACRDQGDRNTVVSFPMDGFDLYELAPEALRVSASSAKQNLGFDVLVRTLLAALVGLQLARL